MAPVPPSLLISFFEAATTSLNRHPDPSGCCDLTANGPCGDLPPSLNAQRKALLTIQVQSLEEAIARYNGERDLETDAISLEDAQEAPKSSNLRLLGVWKMLRGAHLLVLCCAAGRNPMG